MSMELSEVDTEYILEHFKELTDGPFADLTSALRDLNKLPEVLAPANPPLMPSQVLKNVKPFKRSTGRNITTVVVATAIAVSTTLGAAALTGVGPKPIVNFAKSTFKAISSLGSAVVHIVSSPTAPLQELAQQTDSALPIPEPTSDSLTNLETNKIETNKVETNNAEKPNTSEQKVQQTQHETAKIEEQNVEKQNTIEKHPVQVTPTPEIEHATQSAEKTEVKSVEATESKAPEKQEVKATSTPIVKIPEKVETKSPEVRPSTTASAENKSNSESKDD